MEEIYGGGFGTRILGDLWATLGCGENYLREKNSKGFCTYNPNPLIVKLAKSSQVEVLNLLDL